MPNLCDEPILKREGKMRKAKCQVISIGCISIIAREKRGEVDGEG